MYTPIDIYFYWFYPNERISSPLKWSSPLLTDYVIYTTQDTYTCFFPFVDDFLQPFSNYFLHYKPESFMGSDFHKGTLVPRTIK